MRERWIGWFSVGLAADTPWVASKTEVEFGGRSLVLLPGGKWSGYPDNVSFLPSVAVRVAIDGATAPMPIHGKTAPEDQLLEEDVAHEFICSYLSCIAWDQDRPISIVTHEFNSEPVACIPARGVAAIWEGDMHTELAPTADQNFALALYRQAVSAELPVEAVFHFIRVLEAATGLQNEALIPWMADAIERLADGEAQAYVAAQQMAPRELAEHLVRRVRNPVFHAKAPPRVHPDDEVTTAALRELVPVLRGLAHDAIARELGVRSDGRDAGC